ncbi:MAG: hypothetical protein JXA33_28850 [Anaerolineae bacterium]|nr:hypothetical protein [Anaerolineae bacterium]
MLKQLERSLLVGIGVLSITREKAQAFVDELMSYGDTSREEAKGWVDKLVERGEEEKKALRKLVGEEVDKSFKEVRIATQNDIVALKSQIEVLTRKIDALVPTADENDEKLNEQA